jgi:Zn2+/Cd2+-exporting ATPase
MISPPQQVTADCCCTDQPSNCVAKPGFSVYLKHWDATLSLILLLLGLLFDYVLKSPWFSENVRLFWYVAAYLPVAFPVLRHAVTHLRKGNVFTEFFLMGIATLGAFYIGEYPEGVAVMLFYAIGEAFQQSAVQKARANIRALLDVRPETAHVVRGGTANTVHPRTVQPGEIIRVKPGERVPLDGVLLGDRSAFDTSALTGESKPRHYRKGDAVLSGMINLSQVIELEVSKSYENSSISRILELVQEASGRKAKTELFIRSFAKVYTPIVVLLATLLVLVPYFFVSTYVFDEWLYRGLVFLVISCPCALVISIPLGYFGGIGAASRNGILVKGSNYLDALKDVQTVVFDKTGTLTKGEFAVRKIRWSEGVSEGVLPLVLAAEKGSTHPIAKAILAHFEGQVEPLPVVDWQQEVAGMGIVAVVGDRRVVMGSRSLMDAELIPMPAQAADEGGTIVHIAVDKIYCGYILISDEIKEDAVEAIRRLKALGVGKTIMLSGDVNEVALRVGRQLGIDEIYAGLLPQDKAGKLQEIKNTHAGVIAYVGDGINDAPVLALSDVGIAMGAMGSDAAIETADVVIQTDQPSRVATAIQIARSTRNIVWQNIGLAMGVKVLVLGLGALGVATLWEAVFADVGVALLAILNAVRIQKMNFR